VPGTLADTAPIFWALAAVVGQDDDSTVTTGAAILASVPVAVASVGPAVALAAVSGGAERGGTVGQLAVQDGRRTAQAEAPLPRGSRPTDH
jgi:hypothetical protein